MVEEGKWFVDVNLQLQRDLFNFSSEFLQSSAAFLSVTPPLWILGA